MALAIIGCFDRQGFEVHLVCCRWDRSMTALPELCPVQVESPAGVLLTNPLFPTKQLDAEADSQGQGQSAHHQKRSL